MLDRKGMKSMSQQQVTKEAVDRVILKVFNEKSFSERVDLSEIIQTLIKEFQHEPDLTQEQKDRLGEAVFLNPNVMKQLEESHLESEEDGIENFEDYLKYKNEATDARG